MLTALAPRKSFLNTDRWQVPVLHLENATVMTAITRDHGRERLIKSCAKSPARMHVPAMVIGAEYGEQLRAFDALSAQDRSRLFE